MIEAQWLLSPRASEGPLLRQPARTVLTLCLATALASPELDVAALRRHLSNPDEHRSGWFASWYQPQPAAAQPQPPKPGAPRTKPVQPDTLALLPESLQELARTMGGVPDWFAGPSVGGWIDLPGEN